MATEGELSGSLSVRYGYLVLWCFLNSGRMRLRLFEGVGFPEPGLALPLEVALFRRSKEFPKRQIHHFGCPPNWTTYPQYCIVLSHVCFP